MFSVYNGLKPYLEPNVEETTTSSAEPCTSKTKLTITVELDIGVDDPGKDSQVQETVQLSIPEGVQDSGPTVGDHSTQREMQ